MKITYVSDHPQTGELLSISSFPNNKLNKTSEIRQRFPLHHRISRLPPMSCPKPRLKSRSK